MTALRKIDTGAAARAVGGVHSPQRAELTALPRAGANAQSEASVLLHTVLLSAVGGYVDAAGFVSLLGFFPAHLTGELVADAIAVSSGQLGARAARLWLFPVFMGSVVLAALVSRFHRERQRRELTGLLGLLTVSLALFSACDLLAHCFHSQRLPLWLSGGCAVAAMGFQTALIRESLSGACPTTVMTGNLAQVMVGLVDRLITRATRTGRSGQHSSLASVCGALMAFVTCATVGGWLTRRVGTASVWLPTLVTAVLTARAWAEDRRVPARVEHEPAADLWFGGDDELWPDSSEGEALAPPYGAELESVTRIKAEPAVTPEPSERKRNVS